MAEHEPKTMKALTLWRPWAWAIFHGKDVENRTWSPPASMIGQRIAIHAGKKIDEAGTLFIVDQLRLFGLPGPAHATGIIGVATIARIVTESESPWFVGPVGWVLEDYVELPEPIPVKGAQGLWSLTRETDLYLRGVLKRVEAPNG